MFGFVALVVCVHVCLFCPAVTVWFIFVSLTRTLPAGLAGPTAVFLLFRIIGCLGAFVVPYGF